jgi:hypothetical protein
MTSLDVLNASSAIDRNAAQPRRIVRRVGAVFAGLLANVVLATATDAVLHATEVYPQLGQRMSDALFLLAFTYRVIYGIAGSYLTARLAPDRPVQHALALGAVGVAIGTAGAAAMWGAGPAWYSLSIIAVTLPCAWIGGKLAARRQARRT